MRRQRGFTLIELLIVVAIIGIIAAIAIPNMLNAINRGRQKRTMADMRAIATAVTAYMVDNNIVPNVTTITGLADQLETTYIQQLPDLDGWSNQYVFQRDANASEYSIISYGRDNNAGNPTGGSTGDFDCDIIYANGSFWQWPEGLQAD
jgi:general secretion pathway protein G